MSRNATLFKDTSVRASLLQSYVFFAVELQPGDYARGKLAAITRQINRVFPMPVMVLFKVAGNLSIAAITAIAGNARKALEAKTGKAVVPWGSEPNFVPGYVSPAIRLS